MRRSLRQRSRDGGNRCTLHRGTSFDDRRYVRDMRRAIVGDVTGNCEWARMVEPALLQT